MDLEKLINPIHQVQYLGRSAAIRCASGTLPKWTKKEVQLPTKWMVGLYLTIVNLTLQDSGVYTCHGTLNNHTKYRKTFLAYSKLLVAVDGDNIIKPSVRRKEVGTKTTFSCDSSGPLSWYFERFYDHPKHPPRYWSNPLKRYPVLPKDGGIYFCYGLTADQKSPFLAKGLLKVYNNAKINHKKVTRETGSDVEFTTQLRNPLKWYHKEDVLPLNTKVSNDGSKLIIQNITYSNQGYYESSGLDEKGYSIFTRGKLIVISKDEIIENLLHLKYELQPS